jgi:hypothetical protein
MFNYLSRKRRIKLQKGRRRTDAMQYNRVLGRTLRHETLEDRRMLALIGVAPLELPVMSSNIPGTGGPTTTSYDSSTNILSVLVELAEMDFLPGLGEEGQYLTGSTVDINIRVDESGNLIGGNPSLSFDLEVQGVLFLADSSFIAGTMLTGEIVAFGHEDSGGTTDQYDFVFSITGGQLAGLYPNGQAGVILTSADSTFTGDFNVDFGGKGEVLVGAIAAPVGGNASIHGLVWEDFNNDGFVNFGEKAIEGVTVQLLDENGIVIDATTTDDQGMYSFVELDAGTYGVMELQPVGFVDGLEVVGEIDGSPVGDNSINDKITGIVLDADDTAVNYNFGERPEAGGTVSPGQTAAGGFWQNKHGQELILSVNEGLGDWLAATLPNLYGNDGDGDVNPFDLTGKTNAEVAEFYKIEFKKKNKDQPPGPAKLNSQVLATAIAVYVTNSNLAGLAGLDFGLSVTDTGVGTATINVGDNGEAFGVADGADIAILDALFAVNSFTQEGLLYDDLDMDLVGDGAIDSIELALRIAANDVFSMINEDGGI